MTEQRTFFVYVLRSQKDGERYIGLSSNIEERLHQHNSQKVRSTRARTPFVCVHIEEYATLLEAREREKYFKTAAGRRWLKNKGF